jgi:Ion transport protein/Cyclic nucleotide-binding domain/Zinc knuckle
MINIVSKFSKKRNPKEIDSRICGVLRPEQTLRLAWEFIMMISLILLGVLVPYTTAFDDQKTDFSTALDYFSIIIYSIDIIFTLNTGVYSKGKLLLKRRLILKEYSKFWLWLDLISTIPFELILSEYIKPGHFLSSFKLGDNFNIIANLKVLKLIRLFRLKYIIMKIQDHVSSKKVLSMLSILKSMMYLFLVGHFFACVMFLVSKENPSPDGFVSLIELSSNGFTASSGELYVSSLYWAFTTMIAIGYGDLSPRTVPERVVGIFTMIISCVVFGYVLGSVGTIVEKHTSKNKERRELTVSFNKYMDVNNLSYDLKMKVRKYINYIYTHSKNRVDLKEMLNGLSQPLREEIYSHLNGKMVLGVEFLKDLSYNCVSRISRVLKLQINSPNETLFKQNETSKCMYFIAKGFVHIYEDNTKSFIKRLSNESYFGEIGLFTGRPRSASAESLSFLETLCLSFCDLEMISAQFPEMRNKMIILKDFTANGDLTILGVKCYLCNRVGHISKNCDQMIEKENIQKKWIKSRNEIQVIYPKAYKYNLKFQRKAKNLKLPTLHSRNVWGKKRALSHLYPYQNKLRKSIKNYLNGFTKQLDNEFKTTRSERYSSIFSQDSDISMHGNYPGVYQCILTSSSGSYSDQNESKLRNLSFDITLID